MHGMGALREARLVLMNDDQPHDLAAVLDHYGISFRGGREASMQCPVHDDAHASASVNIEKGLWHCHACGGGGSAVHIVMAREALCFRDAVAYLKSMGVDVPVQKRTRNSGARASSRWVPPRLRR